MSTSCADLIQALRPNGPDFLTFSRGNPSRFWCSFLDGAILPIDPTPYPHPGAIGYLLVGDVYLPHDLAYKVSNLFGYGDRGFLTAVVTPEGVWVETEIYGETPTQYGYGYSPTHLFLPCTGDFRTIFDDVLPTSQHSGPAPYDHLVLKGYLVGDDRSDNPFLREVPDDIPPLPLEDVDLRFPEIWECLPTLSTPLSGLPNITGDALGTLYIPKQAYEYFLYYACIFNVDPERVLNQVLAQATDPEGSPRIYPWMLYTEPGVVYTSYQIGS